ncbi:hypothetical protein EYM_02990 [Ignicoccus islandicus DSM 13165]|uniref:KaiC-like domain-containing protein n=1 Tax=Ignicoccus islandicus DSM 13165 TaxID=940295 RepID=A0A0U3DY21_9CREN|nr:hypothetical protein [Ignicoccus islandicus]ALU12378.1 hypothetical protein EYM_02990 [Ignicoccus islandicus DSM 13165]
MASMRLIRLGIPVFDVRVGNVTLGSLQVLSGDPDSNVHMFLYIIAKSWSERGERIAFIIDKGNSEYHRQIAEAMGIAVRSLEEGNMWHYEEAESSNDAIAKVVDLMTAYPLILVDSTSWFDADPELLTRTLNMVAASNAIVVIAVIDKRGNPESISILESFAETVTRFETYWAGLRVERILKLSKSRVPRNPFAAYYSVTKDGINIEELKRL